MGCYLLCSSVAWPFSICSILALLFDLGGLVPLHVATSQYSIFYFSPSHPPLSWLTVYPWDFLFLPLSLRPQCDGGYCGALAQGCLWLDCRLVSQWVFFCLGVWLWLHPPPPPSPRLLGSQLPLGMQVLIHVIIVKPLKVAEWSANIRPPKKTLLDVVSSQYWFNHVISLYYQVVVNLPTAGSDVEVSPIVTMQELNSVMMHHIF